ncbi:MAG: AAA family ATPase [Desulfobacteraceae bacterium]|nr:AAA family ATPase [Desulfobacteraceae bacterium]
MGYAVALGGKGGTGKTTVAGLIIRYMLKKGMKPLLAIDADSNSNLNDVLGVDLERTLSDAREEMKTSVPVGMTKDVYLEMQMEEALVESGDFDLIAMGRPEGPGCYCAANNLLSGLMDRLIRNYDYVVIDNEAGMEHFSRLTQKDIDLLVLVSDPSRRGLAAACRIARLVTTLPMRVSKIVLVINQVRERPAAWPQEVLQIFGEENIACLPADPLIAKYDLEGKPTLNLPEDARVVLDAEAFFQRVFSWR